MNARGNNGYLAVKFKNGDCLTIDSEYLSFEDTRKFPHLLASEIEYLSRYWGEGSETITAEDIVIDTDEIRVFEKGEEVFRYEMTLDEFRKMRKTLWDEEIEDPALYIIDFCRNLVNSKRNK